MEDEPIKTYSTTNTGIALALLAGGLEPPKVIQTFNDDFLRGHGAKDFVDARDNVIPDLQRRKIHGRISYTFIDSGEIDGMLKIYNETTAALKTGKDVKLPKVEPEEAVALAAQLQYNKNAILTQLQHAPPLVRIDRGGGRYTAASANASDELLKELHIL